MKKLSVHLFGWKAFFAYLCHIKNNIKPSETTKYATISEKINKDYEENEIMEHNDARCDDDSISNIV